MIIALLGMALILSKTLNCCFRQSHATSIVILPLQLLNDFSSAIHKIYKFSQTCHFFTFTTPPTSHSSSFFLQHHYFLPFYNTSAFTPFLASLHAFVETATPPSSQDQKGNIMAGATASLRTLSKTNTL